MTDENTDKAQPEASPVPGLKHEAIVSSAHGAARAAEHGGTRHTAQQPAVERRHRSGLRRLFIIVLLLLPVLLAILWLGIEQLQTTQELAQLRAESAAQLSALAATTTVEEDLTPAVDPQMLEELRRSLEARIANVAARTGDLQAQLNAVPQERASDENWLWTETTYLLRQANERLQLQGDRDSALLLLNTVNDMLRDANDPRLLGVRDVLAGEILTLRAMAPVDIAGMYVRLDNLTPLIDQLSLRRAMIENYNQQLAQQRDSSAVENAGVLAQGLDLLASIFVWQRWDETPEALLPPAQDTVLKQNLQLMLEQAQLALLMQEDSVYRISLGKASAWLARYFAIDTGAGRTLRQEIDTLVEQSVIVSRPDISGSLELLQQLDASRVQSADSNGN